MDLKIKRALRKIANKKVTIKDLQDDLQLDYARLKDWGVEKEELDGVCKIILTQTTKESYDIDALKEKYGAEEIDKFKIKTTSDPFYRVTIDKDFYKNN